MAVTETGVTPGIVLVFLQLVSFVISPIEQLPAILANRSAALSIMNKLTEMIQTDAESSTGRTISGVCRRITFENVSFSYDDRKEVLHNICMDFEPGKKYVIVGCSGSGKSTILRLIMRAFENYTGRIMLDETEIREISFESLFRFTSFVQQDVFVFNDTIRNNITLYKEYPEERIAKAMNCAGLAAMAARCVEDSPCGEKGIALSGGERQRISIARAILRRTPVLLMDEATSALDKRTAHEVMEAVLRCKDTLCICVTHRLDDIILRQFDEILVLHDGRFVEHGCFGELIAKKGYFYSLYETTPK